MYVNPTSNAPVARNSQFAEPTLAPCPTRSKPDFSRRAYELCYWYLINIVYRNCTSTQVRLLRSTRSLVRKNVILRYADTIHILFRQKYYTHFLAYKEGAPEPELPRPSASDTKGRNRRGSQFDMCLQGSSRATTRRRGFPSHARATRRSMSSEDVFFFFSFKLFFLVGLAVHHPHPPSRRRARSELRRACGRRTRRLRARRRRRARRRLPVRSRA